jgi:hypothetical protein
MIQAVLVGVLAGLLVLWFVLRSRRASRTDRLMSRVATMDRRHALQAFELSRRAILFHLRNPYGKTTKAQAKAELELAVACLDRIDELEGKASGTTNRAQIRRVLETRFRREADYWLQNDSALEMLGREQEPSVFAARGKLGPVVR